MIETCSRVYKDLRFLCFFVHMSLCDLLASFASHLAKVSSLCEFLRRLFVSMFESMAGTRQTASLVEGLRLLTF